MPPSVKVLMRLDPSLSEVEVLGVEEKSAVEVGEVVRGFDRMRIWFAYVEFSEKDDFEKAVRLDGLEFEGKRVQINAAGQQPSACPREEFPWKRSQHNVCERI